MKIPPFIFAQLPQIAALPVKLTPKRLQSHALTQWVNWFFKPQLDEGDLDFLSSRWLEIRVTDLGQSWFFTLATDDKLQCTMTLASSDVSIVGDFNAFVLLAGQHVDPDTLFFKRKLVIEGDTELGLATKNMLDSVELSRLPFLLREPLVNYGSQLTLAHSITD